MTSLGRQNIKKNGWEDFLAVLKLGVVISLLLPLMALSTCNTVSKSNKQSNAPIPIIKLNPTSPTIGKTEKIACNLNYYDAQLTNDLFFKVRIKRRGGMSIVYPKHSYTFKMDTSYALAAMPTDNDWVLNASYIDKTFMRHKLSFDLYRSLNPKNKAPQCKYVEVFVKEDYKGLYVLMERLDATRLGLDKQDDKAAVFKEPPIFYENPLPLKYIQDTSNYYHQKYPKPTKNNRYNEMDSLWRFLKFAPDSLFAHPTKGAAKWFDIDNVIDWHLMLLFTNNSDGILKNFYLYKTDSLSAYRFAIWDYDHSFGRDGDYAYNMLERNAKCERSPLIKRLLQLNAYDYKNRLKKRWQQTKKKGIFTEKNLTKLIDHNDRVLKNYIAKNEQKWPYKSKFYLDDNTFEQEVAIIRAYVPKRIKYLNDFFENL